MKASSGKRPVGHPSQPSAAGRASRTGRLAVIAAISLQGLIRHQNHRSRYTGPIPAVRLRIQVNEAPMVRLPQATPIAPSASAHGRRRATRR